MKSVLKIYIMTLLLSMAMIIPSSAQGSLNCQATQSAISRTNASSTAIHSQAAVKQFAAACGVANPYITNDEPRHTSVKFGC